MTGEYIYLTKARCDFCGVEHEIEILVTIREGRVFVKALAKGYSLSLYSMHNASRSDDASR